MTVAVRVIPLVGIMPMAASAAVAVRGGSVPAAACHFPRELRDGPAGKALRPQDMPALDPRQSVQPPNYIQ